MEAVYPCLLLLHKTINSLQDYLDLQDDVDALAKWLGDYRLTLNVKKCKSLLISQKKSSLFSSLPPITIQKCALDKVQSYRYLGVLITADLCWSDHINMICAKARKQLGFIYRKFCGHATCSIHSKLFTQLL